LKRILIAWEMGGNWGHLARDLPIALALRARGDQVLFAIRDLPTGEALLAPHGFSFVQAPVLVPPVPANLTPVNHSDMLLAQGYGQPEALRGVLRGWLALLNALNPDLLVSDFAPIAMLAARIAGKAALPIGTGFENPPAVRPFPSIRPWEPVASERLVAADTALLSAFNAALQAFSRPPAADLCELLCSTTPLLTTLPELDHFGPRSRALYVGPIYSPPAHAREAAWPGTLRPRVLAYLNRRTRGLDALLAVLENVGSSLVCVPGGELPVGEPGASRVHREPLLLEPLLREADVIVSNGSMTMSMQALLAGVPMLLLPHVVEQELTARRIEALGAGLGVRGARSEETLQCSLEQLVSDGDFRARARDVAKRYAGESVPGAVARVLVAIDAQRC
jgi:UDP:flavonoid glycosyltransferase YjiC (YdhE family)